MRTISLLIIVLVGCSNPKKQSFKYVVSESDLIFLFEKIEIPIDEDYKIHVLQEEWLNDSSIMVSLTQHGVELKENRFDYEFNYQGMGVYVHSELPSSWVPDSYFRRFLIRNQNGTLIVEPLNIMPFYKIPEGYGVDSLYGTISEDDFHVLYKCP